MSTFDNTLNNIWSNKNISIFYKVRNTKNLEIKFGLREPQAHNVAYINVVHLLYIFLYNVEYYVLKLRVRIKRVNLRLG